MKTLLNLTERWLKTLPESAPTPWQVWLLRFVLLVLMGIAGFLAGAVMAFLVYGFTAGTERNVIPALVTFAGFTLAGVGYGLYLVFLTRRSKR